MRSLRFRAGNSCAIADGVGGGSSRGPFQARTASLAETIEIDAEAAAHSFPHFWEKMFGSGRAIRQLESQLTK